jgi:hypothetical protein
MSLIPLVDYEAVPEEQREHAAAVQVNLRSLWPLADEFGACIGLFAHSSDLNRQLWDVQKGRLESEEGFAQSPEFMTLFRQSMTVEHWQKIAGSSGAIILQGLLALMTKNVSMLHEAPYLRGRLDAAKWREAKKLFKGYFPGIYALRVSAAHPEFNVTPDELRQNVLKTDTMIGGAFIGAQSLLHGSIIAVNDKAEYVSTVQGEPLSFKLEYQSYENLVRVVKLYWAAFAQMCVPQPTPENVPPPWGD